MYKVSVPVLMTDHFRKEETLVELLRAKADRVFLASTEVPFDPAARQEIYDRLAEYIPYFQAAGLEVGVWLWSFVRRDAQNDTRNCQRRIFHDGTEMPCYCPASTSFIQDTQDFLRNITKLGPDVLQFDDDYAFANWGGSPARCYCPRHMARYQEILGEEIDRDSLYEKAFSGKANRYRNAMLQASQETMDNFSQKMREAVDEINPNVRISLCSVVGAWDMDGTNAIRTAKLLAGNTKPILRLMCAPYWAATKAWGNRLAHTVETSRMQCRWSQAEDIEIMSEGDVFPRPRHRVPASFLEGFDTALRFTGVTDGILKYMLDYNSSPRYETGYIDFHLKHQPLYEKIHAAVAGKMPQGVRVYNSMAKYADADLAGVGDPFDYGWDLFFSRAARLLVDNSIPTTYDGLGWCGIAFGENARHLPEGALDNGLILDIRAARILMEQGVDVGIESVGGVMQERRTASGCESTQFLYFPAQDEYTAPNYGGKAAYDFVPKANARVITLRRDEVGDCPDTILYTNAKGQKFMVYGFDAHFTGEDHYRNYTVQTQLLQVIPWLSGKKVPVECAGHPDLYVQYSEGSGERAVGLWNFFADEIDEPVVMLDKAYKSIRFICGSGRLDGDKVILDPIPAYQFAGFVVSET